MRPLSERAKDWKWWLDQVLHFILGGSIGYAFAFEFPWWVGFTFSSVLGIARELIQNLRKDGWHGSKGDAAIDALFWIVGAALGSLVA
jgi:hypothetical protein